MAQHTLVRSFLRGVSGFAGLALVSLVGAGCVGQKDYMALKMQRDNLAEQLADAEAEAAGATRHAEALQSQLGRLETGKDAEGAQLANFQQQIATLTSERDDLMSKYEAMLQKIGTGPALPEALTSELTTFAANNSDVVAFDADNGIVKFKSDLTFQSGDAELTPEARSAIDRFAKILNTPIARQYELQIAGHTDNVNSFSAATKQKGHKDNWYLSSHRAISVSEHLQSKGVGAKRIGVTGFADQRPVASNTTSEGRAQNRRVEVLILPTVASEEQARADESESAPATAAAQEEAEEGQDEVQEMLK